ncbi:glycosyltransferase family 2 protein [Brevibacterium litoralis]|uniref:glycosyltransferase family 2 protein n=1 Tax=Brevibacterium litoralis TaxID=3138935 RepID=UPI0032EC80BD
MESPALTVVVPAKDAADYLGTTFRSLLRQTEVLEKTQVVFVNDGSTDSTPDVLAEYGPRFPSFEVLTNRTALGLASGRNQGLRAARGEYIVFLDGDDWLPDGDLALRLDAVRSLDVDFLRTDHVQVEGTRREARRAPMAVRNRVLPARAGILPTGQSTMVDYPFAWAGIFHRRLLDDGLLLFPEGFMTAEDRAWIWDLHLHADTFAVVDGPGVCYRRGVAGSLTKILDPRQLDFIRAFEGIFDLVEDEADAALYWDKAARNWLAILEHQKIRFSASDASLRASFRDGARRASARIPFEVLRRQFRSVKHDRQAHVHRFLPHGVELLQEAMR